MENIYVEKFDSGKFALEQRGSGCAVDKKIENMNGSAGKTIDKVRKVKVFLETCGSEIVSMKIGYKRTNS